MCREKGNDEYSCLCSQDFNGPHCECKLLKDLTYKISHLDLVFFKKIKRTNVLLIPVRMKEPVIHIELTKHSAFAQMDSKEKNVKSIKVISYQ